jgi:hypothetical protein
MFPEVNSGKEYNSGDFQINTNQLLTLGKESVCIGFLFVRSYISLSFFRFFLQGADPVTMAEVVRRPSLRISP